MTVQSKVEVATLASAMPSARATGLRPQPASRSSQSSVPIAGDYPNFFALYSRERDYTRTLERLLDRSLILLDSEAHRRERAGEDVTHLKAFIKEARS